MKYKRTDTSNGRTMYFVDGKMTSRDKISEPILDMLEKNNEIDVDLGFVAANADINQDECVVCKEEATKHKFLCQVTVGVCDEHYYNTSTGKLAKALRESYERV